MKKILVIVISLFLLFTAKSALAWNFSLIDYAFTTDILEIIDEDYGVEFMSVLSHNAVWNARIGYYKHLEDSDATYAEGKRHWEIGFRWRYFLVERAPNLLFFGFGFDNRPQDNSITPTGEVGLNICIKPVIVSVIGFYGYQLHWGGDKENRWVGPGIEVRAGFCF